MKLRQLIERRWYGRPGWLYGLTPLEAIYRKVVSRRRRRILAQPEARYRAPVPVIVVGNLSVGGTGKSPLVAWLVNHLCEMGKNPGIVARGYGGNAEHYPLHVTADTEPAVAGDEPVMLAAQCGVPVAVSPRRSDAVALLVKEGCDMVISDDGLQHYPLERDLELVVVDGVRGFGNGHCLPVGPLREPLERLADCDAVVVNGGKAPPGLPLPAYEAAVVPARFRRIATGDTRPLSPVPFAGSVLALAGIGHPQRFFATLTELGVEAQQVAYADHHHFSAADLECPGADAVVMTAKDAVKCRSLIDTQPRFWALDIGLEPERGFVDWLDQRLAGL